MVSLHRSISLNAYHYRATALAAHYARVCGQPDSAPSCSHAVVGLDAIRAAPNKVAPARFVGVRTGSRARSRTCLGLAPGQTAQDCRILRSRTPANVRELDAFRGSSTAQGLGQARLRCGSSCGCRRRGENSMRDSSKLRRRVKWSASSDAQVVRDEVIQESVKSKLDADGNGDLNALLERGAQERSPRVIRAGPPPP